MKTESTLYFDGQFWVGVIERHEADRVRAVRIVFGAQPSDAEFYEFLLTHANALLCRLDERLGFRYGPTPDDAPQP